MTAKAKTSPKRPGRRLGMNDPEVLAMFNELAEMKYQQYLAGEKAEKRMATAAAQGDAVAQRRSKISTTEDGPKGNWAPWLTDPDPEQPRMSKAQSEAAAKAVKALMESARLGKRKRTV